MKPTILLIILLIFSNLLAQQKHTVQPKETVYGISTLYSISQTDLLKANPTIEANGLQPGDVLQIPSGEEVYEANKGTIISNSNGKIRYKVAPKETLYAIGKKFNVSQEELLQWNPELKDGLKARQVIHLMVKDYTAPVKAKQKTKLANFKPKELKKRNFQETEPHTVKPGETVLSLMMRYRVRYAEILEANPGLLQTGLQVGSTIQIPSATAYDYASLAKFNDEKINLLFLLPFNLSEAQNKVRNVSIDFLTGSKMALETLAGNGKNINLIIRDTRNNKEELLEELGDIDWNTIDAVIGPLYGELIAELAQELQGEPVDIFSPFNNDKELEEFANVFITAPRDEYLADAVAEELRGNYAGEEILIYTNDEDMELAKYTAKKIQELVPGGVNRIITDAEELVQPSETISETLEDGSAFDQTYYTPIITVLVSGDKALGQEYLDKILAMNPDNLKAYGVKFIPQYDATIPSNQNNLRKLLNIGFAYAAERLANVYGKEEKKLIKKFQDKYCKPPSKYQQIGYDLVMDVVDRMNASGNLHDEILATQARFSTKFEYERIGPNQAHVNKGVRMVRLYKKKTITEPK